MDLLPFSRNPQTNPQSQDAMVRVVHGTEDVHALIRKAVAPKASTSSNCQPENDNNQNQEHEEVLETNVNGVWSLLLGSRMFDTGFEAIKVIPPKSIIHSFFDKYLTY